MKIGFFGGTFDPIHHGHLRLAAAAQQAFGLERILFVPARRPWHKRGVCSPYRDRWAMLSLALVGHPDWRPTAIPSPEAPELPPECAPGSSYSVEEVGWLREQCPDAEIYFLLGLDALRDLPTWKEFRRLLTLCHFIVADRRSDVGSPSDLPELAALLPADMIAGIGDGSIALPASRLYPLRGFNEPASSRHLRARLAAGEWADAQALLPPPVLEYIRRAGLYRVGASEETARHLLGDD